MKKLIDKIKTIDSTSLIEAFIILLLIVGIPSVAVIYFDWRAGYTTLIINLLILSTLRLRYGGN